LLEEREKVLEKSAMAAYNAARGNGEWCGEAVLAVFFLLSCLHVAHSVARHFLALRT
jgi:hypothetical protein